MRCGQDLVGMCCIVRNRRCECRLQAGANGGEASRKGGRHRVGSNGEEKVSGGWVRGGGGGGRRGGGGGVVSLVKGHFTATELP